MSARADMRIPQASGEVVFDSGSCRIDASNTSSGYVMVRYNGGASDVKVEITKNGLSYIYNLPARGQFETFPLSEGSGCYSLKVYEHAFGNQYTIGADQSIYADITDTFGPFLYPNQFVSFYPGSASVNKSNELSSGAADKFDKINRIYDFVINSISYDYAKAATVTTWYVPNVDSVLSSRSGICFDYSALMAAMLRAQGIPAKLCIGYAGSQTHAWINVYVDGTGWIDNYIYFDGKNWSRMDPTFASSGKNADSIKQFIGNSANYVQMFCY